MDATEIIPGRVRRTVEPCSRLGVRDIRPDALYPLTAVASLFGVSIETAARWCRSGKVKAIPRATPQTPYRVLGAVMLALVGEMAGSVGEPSETRAERAARAKRAVAGFRK